MDAHEAANLRAWTQGRTEGSLGQCSLVSTHTSPLPLSGVTSVVPENTSVPLSKPHCLQETPLATQSPNRLCTPRVPLRLIHRLAKVLLWPRHCCGKPGGDSRKLLGPGRALFPDPGGGYTADTSAFRDLKTADLHTSLEVTAPVNKQTWFYFNKVIQPLLVVPRLAILRFLQTTEISF